MPFLRLTLVLAFLAYGRGPTLTVIPSPPQGHKPMTKPRTFTRHELLTMTTADWLALPVEDAKAWANQWLDLMIAETANAEDRYLTGDYDQIASHRRYEIGE